MDSPVFLSFTLTSTGQDSSSSPSSPADGGNVTECALMEYSATFSASGMGFPSSSVSPKYSTLT